MSKVVSHTQCSIVPGRLSADNILVAQAIHTMRSKKGKVGFMAIKVDLEKVYDIYVGISLEILL